jgi:hypothetical protein
MGNEDHELGTGFFVHMRIISAVMMVEFVSDKIDDVKDSLYEELECIFDNIPKYHKKMLSGDFSAKIGREDIFKPTVWNKSLHEICNDDGVRVVNFATSNNLTVRSIIFPHHKIHKYMWTSPDWKTHDQIDHILIDRRRHSSVLDVRSFRAADCHSDHYVVVAKIRERTVVNKEGLHKFHTKRFNLRKLSEVYVKEKYRGEVSNRLAALEDS